MYIYILYQGAIKSLNAQLSILLWRWHSYCWISACVHTDQGPVA